MIAASYIHPALSSRSSNWCTSFSLPPFNLHHNPVREVRWREKVTGSTSLSEVHGKSNPSFPNRNPSAPPEWLILPVKATLQKARNKFCFASTNSSPAEIIRSQSSKENLNILCTSHPLVMQMYFSWRSWTFKIMQLSEFVFGLFKTSPVLFESAGNRQKSMSPLHRVVH